MVYTGERRPALHGPERISQIVDRSTVLQSLRAQTDQILAPQEPTPAQKAALHGFKEFLKKHEEVVPKLLAMGQDAKEDFEAQALGDLAPVIDALIDSNYPPEGLIKVTEDFFIQRKATGKGYGEAWGKKIAHSLCHYLFDEDGGLWTNMLKARHPELDE